MKKLIFAVLSVLLLASAALAETVTGLAIEIDPEHLESCAVYVRATAYHEETETISIEIITPEKFDANDIDKLSVGDSIFTNGKEIKIESITEEYVASSGAIIILNKGTDSVWLHEDDQQNYRTIDTNDYVWLSVAALEIPLPDGVLFLDGVNPEDGGILDLPLVKNKNDLIKVLCQDKEDYHPGLDCNNAYAIFNEEGELAVIERYFNPTGIENCEKADEELPDGSSADTVLYYHPSGGEYYHLDRNCKSVHPKYLPLQGTFMYSELDDKPYCDLKPCKICGAP